MKSGADLLTIIPPKPLSLPPRKPPTPTILPHDMLNYLAPVSFPTILLSAPTMLDSAVSLLYANQHRKSNHWMKRNHETKKVKKQFFLLGFLKNRSLLQPW